MKDRMALSCVLTLCLVFTLGVAAPFMLMVPAEATADEGDAALAVDFGSVGLYRYTSAGWSPKLNSNNPVEMVALDIDNDTYKELAASFAGSGLYMWDETSGWKRTHTQVPEAMVACDAALAVDFGSVGLYRYTSAGWDPKLNTNNPVEMVAVDIDNDTHQELAVSFAGLGLYIWDETNGWKRINTQVPEAMVACDAALAVDFGVVGLYRYTSAGWDPKLNSSNPVEMVAVDIDNDTHQELAASFAGLGLYIWDETNGWKRTHTQVPEAMVACDAALAVDFGSVGLYRYTSAGWDPKLNTNNPVEMVALDIDNDTHQELAVSFAGLGLYIWDETNGWKRINTQVPEAMIATGKTVRITRYTYDPMGRLITVTKAIP